MNEQEFEEKLESIEKKIDSIEEKVSKIRRNQMIRSALTILFFVLPLIALLFSVPFLIDALTAYGDLLP